MAAASSVLADASTAAAPPSIDLLPRGVSASTTGVFVLDVLALATMAACVPTLKLFAQKRRHWNLVRKEGRRRRKDERRRGSFFFPSLSPIDACHLSIYLDFSRPSREAFLSRARSPSSLMSRRGIAARALGVEKKTVGAATKERKRRRRNPFFSTKEASLDHGDSHLFFLNPDLPPLSPSSSSS